MRKRILSLFMIAVMCITLIPATQIHAAKKGNIYIVEKGDNLYNIAKELDLSWVDIAKLNNIKEPFTINIGQKLQLPLTEEENVTETPVIIEENWVDIPEANEPASYSIWAQADLIIGDSYGIYPQYWYELGLTGPIKQGKFLALMAGIRTKILNTDCVTLANNKAYNLTDYMTVEEALITFYDLVSTYEFTEDIGIKDREAIDFMTKQGIYTGANGELILTDICTIEQACVFATRLITYIYNALDVGSKGFLWEAQLNENTVYLLGSIHMASYDIYPFSEKMLEAYRTSDALVVELNMFDMTGAMAIMELGVYTDGTTLKDHVSEDTYRKTIELTTMMGYEEEQIAIYKPWYIYTMFGALVNTDTGNQAEATLAATLGIDMNFMVNALIYGKPIIEIEGYEYQGMVLDSFSDELEEYLLSGTVDAIYEVLAGTYSKGADNLDLMLEYWKSGDTEAFKSFTSLQYEFPELYEEGTSIEEKSLIEEFILKLLKQRDKRMAEYIDSLLTAEGSSTHFVVVGSGHFISDYSVLDILKEMGYDINQIK